jgi:hypothetical protein
MERVFLGPLKHSDGIVKLLECRISSTLNINSIFCSTDFVPAQEASEKIVIESSMQQATVFRPTPISEREADRQNRIVIAGMEVRRGDLVSAPDRKADSSPQTKASHDQPRCHEILLVAVVLSILREC